MVAEVNPMGGNQSALERSASNGVSQDGGSPARRKTIDRRQSADTGSLPESERRRSQDRRGSQDSELGSPADPGSNSGHGERGDVANQLQAEQDAHELVKLRRLLATCEKVMMVNYDLLALDDYPSNLQIDAAVKMRDAYVSVAGLVAGIFVVGLAGLLPAYVTGASFGLSLLFFALGLTDLQSLLHNAPSVSQLLRVRRQLEFNALSHIKYLEGSGGLAWRCSAMSAFNGNLHNNLFTKLVDYSKNGTLLRVLRNKKHIRLYLLFMLEAQKAYKSLQSKVLSS